MITFSLLRQVLETSSILAYSGHPLEQSLQFFTYIPATEQLIQLPIKLHYTNIEIWKLEDHHYRLPVVVTKERHENGRKRDQIIHDIDEFILDNEVTPSQQSFMISETPGMITDRLSILFIKRLYGAEVSEEIEHLGFVYDTVIDGLESGSLLFRSFSTVKIYDKRPFFISHG